MATEPSSMTSTSTRVPIPNLATATAFFLPSPQHVSSPAATVVRQPSTASGWSSSSSPHPTDWIPISSPRRRIPSSAPWPWPCRPRGRCSRCCCVMCEGEDDPQGGTFI